jgi:hypothetical protein
MMPLRPYLFGGAAAGALIAGVVAAFLSIASLVSHTSFPGATEVASPVRPDTLPIGVGDGSGSGTSDRAPEATAPPPTAIGLPTTVASVGLAPSVLPSPATEGGNEPGARPSDDEPSARGAGGPSGSRAKKGPGGSEDEPTTLPAPGAGAPSGSSDAKVTAGADSGGLSPGLAKHPGGLSPGLHSGSPPPGLAKHSGGGPPGLAKHSGGGPPGIAKQAGGPPGHGH